MDTARCGCKEFNDTDCPRNGHDSACGNAFDPFGTNVMQFRRDLSLFVDSSGGSYAPSIQWRIFESTDSRKKNRTTESLWEITPEETNSIVFVKTGASPLNVLYCCETFCTMSLTNASTKSVCPEKIM